MKNYICNFLSVFLVLFFLPLSSCQSEKSDVIRFVTSAEYPPFEYKVHGKLMGLDIDLARLIGKELGKTVEFQDMQFSAVLAALQSDRADAGISTIAITEKRKENFDFSTSYHKENMALIFKKTEPIAKGELLSGKKIVCQLGTTMEIWLRNQPQGINIVTMDNNMQGVEALKTGHVEGVMVDAMQAVTFTKKNPELAYIIIARADEGYAIAFKKGSPLRDEVNKALETLKSKGAIEKLKKKYLDIKS